MSKQQDSNVIHIDFSSRQTKSDNGVKSFSQLLNEVVPNPYDDQEEWQDNLTPKERSEQLKSDLEFLRQMSDAPPVKKY